MSSFASLAIKENIQTWFGRGFLKIQFQLIFSILSVFIEDFKWKDYISPFHRWGNIGTGPKELGKTLPGRGKIASARGPEQLRPGGGAGGRWHLPSITCPSRMTLLLPKMGGVNFSIFFFPFIKTSQKGNDFFFLHFFPRQTEQILRLSSSLMSSSALTGLLWVTMIWASRARGNKRQKEIREGWGPRKTLENGMSAGAGHWRLERVSEEKGRGSRCGTISMS